MREHVDYLDVIERGEVLVAKDSHVRTLMSLGSEFEDRQFFSIRVRRGRYYLTAGKYVGVIPISRELVLRVRPKVSTGQLIRILRLAGEPPLLIDLLDRSYAEGVDLSVQELLVRALHRELPVLMQHGPLREYRRRSDSAQAVRGRIQIGRTVSELWPKASFDKAAFEFFEFTADTALNQALEYTIWLVRRTLSGIVSSPDIAMVRDFADAHQVLASVAPDRSRGFLIALRQHLRDQVTEAPFASFRPILTLCRMILDGIGIDLEHDADHAVDLVPLVVDMESAFQNMLLRSMQHRSAWFDTLECWDTSRQNQRALLTPEPHTPPEAFVSRTSGRAAKPDFTFALEGAPVLVGDAKYKSAQDVHDVYQAVSHAAAYGAPQVMLFYPTTGSKEPLRLASLGRVGDIGLFVCAVPLDADDLDAELDTLIGRTYELIEYRKALAPSG